MTRNKQRTRRIQIPSRTPDWDFSDGDDEGNNSEYERAQKRRRRPSREYQKEDIPDEARSTNIDHIPTSLGTGADRIVGGLSSIISNANIQSQANENTATITSIPREFYTSTRESL